ncbi:MAG: hypothetical protein AAFR64_10505 [Pseudomonadota bacterium]
MKAVRYVFGICISLACATASAQEATFVGRIDEAAYEAYYQSIPREELQAECTALTLSHSELTELIEAYVELPSTTAYMTLIVTPCLIEDGFVFEGRISKFRWYPSGYLVVFYRDNEADARYFVCPEASGPEDERVITVDEIRGLLCK